jgi:hypothetical protein
MMFNFFFLLKTRYPAKNRLIQDQFCCLQTAAHLKPDQSPARTSPTPQLLAPEGIKPETLKGVYQTYTTRPTPRF